MRSGTAGGTVLMQRRKLRKLRRPEGKCYREAGRLVSDQREGAV